MEKSGWSPPSIAGRNRLTHFSFYFSGRVFAPPRSHASHIIRIAYYTVWYCLVMMECERSREAVLWCCGSMVRCHTKHVKSRRGCAVNEEPTRGGKKGWNFFFSPRLTPTWTQDKNFHPIGRRTGNKFPVEKRKKGNYCLCNGHYLRLNSVSVPPHPPIISSHLLNANRTTRPDLAQT